VSTPFATMPDPRGLDAEVALDLARAHGRRREQRSTRRATNACMPTG
jgi:hypothetical protein